MSKNTEELILAEFRNKMRKDIGNDINNRPIADLGIDSLDFFEILIYIEDELGIIIPIEELDNTVTIDSLISSIQ
ncbi:MAG: acyl carrier protein [Alcanivoracaceae bacterium]|nr:acyl carrier protein [Alcanivoracaceae bacterium]